MSRSTSQRKNLMTSDIAKPAETAAPAATPKRSPGHRGQDVRDTVAEMAAKAHEISLEAGSKMAAAMKDVVGAAAGLVAFSLESARDLVQYMVRRGQMTQDEADKLVRSAEEAWVKKHKGKLPPKPSAIAGVRNVVSPFKPSGGLAKKPAAKPAAKAAKKPAAKKAAAKKPAAKKPAKKAAAKKPAAKKPARKK
jgi:polyhydroxyalkanoate synthesis regulator phasin